MMIPDYQLIAQIMLYSEDFDEAVIPAEKLSKYMMDKLKQKKTLIDKL